SRVVEPNANGASTVVQPQANSSSPIPILREKENCSTRSSKKKGGMVSMPSEFTISESVWTWSNKQGLEKEQVEEEVASFCNDRLSKGVQYADWDRAFMTWLGRNKEFTLLRRNGHRSSTNGRRPQQRDRIPL